MKVTLITPVFPFPNKGVYVGIERFAYELAISLKKKGIEVSVITSLWNGGNKFDNCEGIPIYRSEDSSLKYGKLGRLFDLHYYTLGKEMLEFRNILSNSDVIHTIGPLSSTNEIRKMNIPLLSLFHHYESMKNPKDLLVKPFHHLIEKNTYLQSDFVITPSRASKFDLINKFKIQTEKIEVIPHGVDTDKFKPVDRNKNQFINLLFVGGLEERKGISYLIEAFRHVNQKYKNVNLIIVGSGSLEEILRKKVLELNLENFIEFKGLVDDEELIKYYQNADVFVFPSLLEGFGMVLLEAMACGLPVISTNVSAIPEVVGDTGILVEPRNPEAFSRAMITLLENESERKELSLKGLERIKENFSWDIIADLYISKYIHCIKGR